MQNRRKRRNYKPETKTLNKISKPKIKRDDTYIIDDQFRKTPKRKISTSLSKSSENLPHSYNSSTRLSKSVLSLDKISEDLFATASYIIFGLETTSLYSNCKIIQISATNFTGKLLFNVHIETKTSFTETDQHCQGKYVAPVHVKEALVQFSDWLNAQGNHIVLFGHNIGAFDIKHLQRIIVENRLKSHFGHLVGFVDTLPLMHHKYPGEPSYALERLYREKFGGKYEVHNARYHVRALSEMLRLSDININVMRRFSMTFDWSREGYSYSEDKRRKSCN